MSLLPQSLIHISLQPNVVDFRYLKLLILIKLSKFEMSKVYLHLQVVKTWWLESLSLLQRLRSWIYHDITAILRNLTFAFGRKGIKTINSFFSAICWTYSFTLIFVIFIRWIFDNFMYSQNHELRFQRNFMENIFFSKYFFKVLFFKT